MEIVRSQVAAWQCLVATIQHRLEAETSATANNGLWQLKPPALALDGLVDEVKCENLERVIVADDPKRFFYVEAKLPLQEKERLLEFLRKCRCVRMETV